MNKLIAIAVGAVISVGHVGAALAAPPAWCKSVPKNDRYDLADLSKGLDDLADVVVTFAYATCSPTPEAEANKDQIAKARAAWSKKLMMTEDDWADVGELAEMRSNERNYDSSIRINTNGQEMGIGDSLKRPWTSFDAIDQWVLILNGVGGSGDFTLDDNYFVDSLGQNLTETGRAAYIKVCIEDKSPVQWAMCQADIDRLDYTKLATELRTLKTYTGAPKMMVRVKIQKLKAALVKHAATVKALIAKDAGYQRLFDVAKTVNAEWTSRYTKDAALIALAKEMDDARATNSRKAFAGCQDKTWAAFKAAVSAIPAKKWEGMTEDRKNAKSFSAVAMGPLISDPNVYLAAVAMVTCNTKGLEKDGRNDHSIEMLSDAMNRWPGFRGPRNATQSMIMTTGVELDDRDAKLDYPGVLRYFSSGMGRGEGKNINEGKYGGIGTVASVKKSGDTALITFKKEMVKQEQCASSRTSNRISQIRSDGVLVYQSTCTSWETVTVDKSSDPQTVYARYVDGLKPGMKVTVEGDIVTGAWANNKAKVPAMVFGAPVK
ncbi:MAG: hypothetical protein H0T42_08715 [Deltaproteobacteria bacterium]|nr:hypothetical protein [Deltaproteobacteria bacterium]